MMTYCRLDCCLATSAIPKYMVARRFGSELLLQSDADANNTTVAVADCKMQQRKTANTQQVHMGMLLLGI